MQPVFRLVVRLVVRLVASALPLIATPALAAAAERRPLALDDLFALATLDDPRLSPEGDWVAYTSERLERERDEVEVDLWMAPFAGGEPVRLTTREGSEDTPRWSPDGRWLAFLAADDCDTTQVWLLDRRGGEPAQLTSLTGGVSDLAWAPDARQLALVVADAEPAVEAVPAGECAVEEPPRPIVVRRLQFKRDGEGFLDERRSHLHLFDLATRRAVQLTDGPFDDETPAWSPDGAWIAFVSNRTAEPDANDNRDLFVVAPRAGEAPRALTRWAGADSEPAFSPDGRWIAYVAGGDPADVWYDTSHLAVVAAAGGEPRAVTAALDRNVLAPRWSADGRSLYFLLEDGGNQHLARVPATGGAVERVVDGEREVLAFDVGVRERLAVLETSPHQPPEVSVGEPATRRGTSRGPVLRRLTHANDALLAGIALARVERLAATSADGTPIDGFLVVPAGGGAGERLPTILDLHGGPVSQFTTAFAFDWQLYAARGYAVVGANPRGSSGYGRAFSRALWADWGNLDYQDVMAAVDAAIARGTADPERLAVGGWSYGGILTNYVITRTGRFRAAVSGASEVNYLANYGTDHYQREWEAELGLPWQNTDLWIRLSPFFAVEKITTPTLILCGEEDWNVPLLNSEQLFQALRRLGRETELVVYPGESHSLERPSFQRDRLERWIAWYDRYVKGEGGADAAAATAAAAPGGGS